MWKQSPDVQNLVLGTDPGHTARTVRGSVLSSTLNRGGGMLKSPFSIVKLREHLIN